MSESVLFCWTETVRDCDKSRQEYIPVTRRNSSIFNANGVRAINGSVCNSYHCVSCSRFFGSVLNAILCASVGVSGCSAKSTKDTPFEFIGGKSIRTNLNCLLQTYPAPLRRKCVLLSEEKDHV